MPNQPCMFLRVFKRGAVYIYMYNLLTVHADVIHVHFQQ